MIFIHKGWKITNHDGTFLLVEITYHSRGIIYQIDFDTKKPTFYVFCSFYTQNDIKRIRTTFRAFSFCERDFILPNELETHMKKGDFNQNQKKE
jgi:homogentisate 1,2-dioxygenase